MIIFRRRNQQSFPIKLYLLKQLALWIAFESKKKQRKSIIRSIGQPIIYIFGCPMRPSIPNRPHFKQPRPNKRFLRSNILLNKIYINLYVL